MPRDAAAARSARLKLPKSKKGQKLQSRLPPSPSAGFVSEKPTCEDGAEKDNSGAFTALPTASNDRGQVAARQAKRLRLSKSFELQHYLLDERRQPQRTQERQMISLDGGGRVGVAEWMASCEDGSASTAILSNERFWGQFEQHGEVCKQEEEEAGQMGAAPQL
jgi:hypothetical protein